jgi:hypothetical protein
METTLVREITVPLRDSSRLEFLLMMNGFKDFAISYAGGNGRKATLIFDHEEDVSIFFLKGILEKLNDNTVFYCPEPEFDFMIRLEKKLKTFSKADEYLIRRIMKEK